VLFNYLGSPKDDKLVVVIVLVVVVIVQQAARRSLIVLRFSSPDTCSVKLKSAYFVAFPALLCSVSLYGAPRES